MKTHLMIQSGAARWCRMLALVGALGCWGLNTWAEEESSIEETFRDALYAEEVKGDIEAALKVYQDVGARFDHQRDLAATALFREGECLRKLKRDVEAAEAYGKVLALYGDVARVATQARESLATMGKTAPEPPEGGPGMAVDQEATEILRLKKLVAESPDLLHASTDDQPPPLHEAAAKGQRRVAAFLLDSGAKVDLVWKDETPLQTAARTGHLAMCELLMERGANGEEDKSRALVIALANGREAVANLLLDHKADPNLATIVWQSKPNSSSYDNATALQMAVEGDFDAVLVNHLLAAGADTTKSVTYRGLGVGVGTNPLLAAVWKNKVETVKALLEHGADPNGIPDGSTSPLCTALRNEKSSESTDSPIVNALLEAGADWTNESTSDGESALAVAASQGLLGWMHKAIDGGCKVDAPSEKSGKTALFTAAGYLQPTSIRFLLEAGANPNALTNDGIPVLSALGRYGPQTDEQEAKRLACFKLLLKAGADPNVLWGGKTILSYVVIPVRSPFPLSPRLGFCRKRPPLIW